MEHVPPVVPISASAWHVHVLEVASLGLYPGLHLFWLFPHVPGDPDGAQMQMFPSPLTEGVNPALHRFSIALVDVARKNKRKTINPTNTKENIFLDIFYL